MFGFYFSLFHLIARSCRCRCNTEVCEVYVIAVMSFDMHACPTVVYVSVFTAQSRYAPNAQLRERERDRTLYANLIFVTANAPSFSHCALCFITAARKKCKNDKYDFIFTIFFPTHNSACFSRFLSLSK